MNTNPSNGVVVDVKNMLECSPLFRGRSHLIRIDVDHGTLMLEGRLPSFYLKQMLQTLLRDVDGVEKIDNRVAVNLVCFEDEGDAT